MKIITKSEKETYNFAKEFAGNLQGGEVLCLIGDLGAGKTAFTKGLAVGLGVTNIITSPTFVLMKVYQAKKQKNTKIPKPALTLVHIDAYRLENGEQLLGIGVDDYFSDQQCVTVIEWADRVSDIWPNSAIKIEFKVLKGDRREIKVS